MASLWHLLLLCWAWSPLCLPSSVSFIGTPQECEQAHFVPGYNLGGEGFDIVTMERKGAYVINTETWKLQDGTCRMYRNSYMNQEKQKVPVAVLDWRILPKCSLAISGILYDSAETLANDSTSSVSNDWKVGLEIPVTGSVGLGVGFGGSHSKASSFAMQKSKQDRYSFLRHSVKCNLYSYRLASNPPLSHDFQSVVQSLPAYSTSTEHLYRNLIDTYGTHFITQVYLGGEMKSITSIKTCEASMNDLSATDAKNCLSVEASLSFASSASIKAMTSHCNEMRKKLNSGQSFSSAFSERYTEVTGGHINGVDILFQGQANPSLYNNWISSLKHTPDVVQYNIKPMHMILPSSHHARSGLKREVEKYIKKNALMKQCSESCQVGQRSSRRDPCACVCDGNQNVRSNCCPAGRGLATLKVFQIYGRGLYGDVCTQTDGSVEVKYGDQIVRTAIIANDDNPSWSEQFEFGPITLNMVDRLEIDVYDEDYYWNSNHLGGCLVKPQKGWWEYTCMLNHGTLFFSLKVECAPSLGGAYCDEYIPSPMSPPLAKVFHTRNGILLGQTGEKDGKSVGPEVEVKHKEAL